MAQGPKDADHDDRLSVFPCETDTLSALSSHAYAMNHLIAPRITGFKAQDGRIALAWSEVVSRPAVEIQSSTNLQAWMIAGSTPSNVWSEVLTSPPRFYRVRPYWP